MTKYYIKFTTKLELVRAIPLLLDGLFSRCSGDTTSPFHARMALDAAICTCMTLLRAAFSNAGTTSSSSNFPLISGLSLNSSPILCSISHTYTLHYITHDNYHIHIKITNIIRRLILATIIYFINDAQDLTDKLHKPIIKEL